MLDIDGLGFDRILSCNKVIKTLQIESESKFDMLNDLLLAKKAATQITLINVHNL